MVSERVIEFACHAEQLLGILAEGEQVGEVGVVIVVGGPQYRVGSHRQFTLLARDLASVGFSCLRFDHRGIGDSTGDPRRFEDIQDDIAAAIDALSGAVPSLRHVVLWGLCDAASAILMYWHATRDKRLSGLCLLNPWVRSDQSLAEAQVRHYYRDRLTDPEFWRKLLGGKVGVIRSVGKYLSKRKLARAPSGNAAGFQLQMGEALLTFPGSVQLIMSGRDYTAAEFDLWLGKTSQLAIRERPNLQRIDLPEADHTFSSTSARRAVANAVRSWLGQLGAT